MPPKYDLIFEDEGNLTIKEIDANDQQEAVLKGCIERSKLKGIIFSDKNETDSKEEIRPVNR